MLLGMLLQALLARAITLVATSSIRPDSLYRKSLERVRFFSTIDLINEYCNVINIDAAINYRQRTLTQANLYLMPLNAQIGEALDRMLLTLVNNTQK